MRLTRANVVYILKNYDEEEAKAVLVELFSRPENMGVFGWFCFPELINQTTPDFHDKLWALYQEDGFKGAAAPRGMAKSAITNQVYHAWLIAYKKKHFIVQVSDTFTQAKEQVETLAYLLETSDTFHYLYGDLRTRRWKASDIETTTQTRVLAKGQGMKLRGLRYRSWRPDLITFDDLENDESVKNPERRRKTKQWVLNSALPALAPPSEGGEAIFIGTILHHDSILSNIVKKRGEFSSYKVLIFKALNTSKMTGLKFSLWPSRFPVKHLVRMGSDPTYAFYIGSLAFAQEMQNEPSSDKDAVIKPAWIGSVDQRSNYPRKIVTIAMDPAISKKETADYTGKVAAEADREGNVTIFKIGNDRFDFPENIADMKVWNEQIKPHTIVVEEVAFQTAYKSALAGLPIKGVKPDTDKRRRILSISAFFEAGRIRIMRGIANEQVLITQLTEFPSSAHDDLVDAAYYAIMELIGGTVGTYGEHDPDEHKRSKDSLPGPDEPKKGEGTTLTGLRKKVF